jgi:hypothetical protein
MLLPLASRTYVRIQCAQLSKMNICEEHQRAEYINIDFHSTSAKLLQCCGRCSKNSETVFLTLILVAKIRDIHHDLENY